MKLKATDTFVWNSVCLVW